MTQRHPYLLFIIATMIVGGVTLYFNEYDLLLSQTYYDPHNYNDAGWSSPPNDHIIDSSSPSSSSTWPIQVSSIPPPPPPPTMTCDGFFTVLANVWIPDESAENNITCASTYAKFQEQLEVHNAQLLKMNSTMVVFTTWTKDQLREEGSNCSLDKYPALRQVQFDPQQLLLESSDDIMTPQVVDWISSWQNVTIQNPKGQRRNHLVTRLSDLFRIVLAKKYNLAYADLDMVYLSNDQRVYVQEPNVAVPIWSEEKGALEIQNSGFCFNPAQLNVLLRNAITIIQSKGPVQTTRNKYIYTELGNVYIFIVYERGAL